MANNHRTCQVCGKSLPANQLIHAAVIRPAIVDVIRREVPQWSDDGDICLNDLNQFRNRYIQNILESEKGELTDLEDEVLQSLMDHDILASNVEEEIEEAVTFGERLSDRMASFGGSWAFIIVFACVMLAWITLNSVTLLSRPFDPFPYILLNLVLSCLAAIQAPVIMMSQNRQEAKDRLRSQHDYQVNLKAELEIRQLHQKVDHLLSHQWERLVEIQRVQLELMNDLRNRKG
ncbi:MAG: DUF1003 domain-containing protein [Phycisphaera sp.]|nr:DUF1003 domain-containing protein [Phycisphaera sp.]